MTSIPYIILSVATRFLAAASPFADSQPAAPATQPAKATSSFLEQLRLDDLFQENNFWRWLILLLAIIAGLAAGRIASFILNRLSQSVKKHHWNSNAIILASMSHPASLALFTFGLSIGLAQISMSDTLQGATGQFILLFYLVALFWLAFNLVAILENALLKVTKRTATTLDDQLVPVIRKGLRLFIVVIGALFILQNVFHRDVGAWLAGLGIAGLAVSLSAQDSLKNLFGSITILFDHPFALGHLIKYDQYLGTVEEIGFRSTKIRTADGTLVTVPNSNIVNDPVENWSARPAARRLLNIHLPYDTPIEKLERAVQIANELLESAELREPIHDPDTTRNADPPRVYFNEFNNDSLNIQIFYWFRSLDGWQFAEHAQRFNIHFLQRLSAEGIYLAQPTQRLNLINAVSAARQSRRGCTQNITN